MFVYLYISFWQDNLQPMAEVRISFVLVVCLCVCYLTKSTILSRMLVGSVCEFVCVYVSLYRSHFKSECHGTSPTDLLATRIEPYNFWHVKVKGQGQEKFLKIAKIRIFEHGPIFKNSCFHQILTDSFQIWNTDVGAEYLWLDEFRQVLALWAIFICLSVCLFLCRISQKVVDGSGWNYVYRLGVWRGRTG